MPDEPREPVSGEEQPPDRKSLLPKAGLFRNLISWVGSAIALVSLANILFLLLLDLSGVKTNPYVGIIAYIILPSFLVFGLILIPVGMLLERRRRRRRAPEILPYPRIDLNQPHQRNAFAFIVVSFLFFLLLSAVGSYRAYEYTETTEFCGQLCHSVMHPEFIAYQASPHARVTCVQCHVGPGAGWYVRSKMSGLYQVYATTFNLYPKPIPTPVANLRPAQETCEQCHWPEKFHGAQLRVYTHYGSDEQNTRRQIDMLIKTGGGSPTGGLVSGIHWHMNIANEITYAATDEHRQIIPWVRMKDMQGRITEYKAADSALTPEEIERMPKRRMDCVDCHNRPSHIYVPPDRSVDSALFAERLNPNMPFIKKVAVEALTQEYDSTSAAMEGIATYVDKYYLTQQPEFYKQNRAQVKQAIDEVQRLFGTTIFPDMKVDWRTHPNNIGHFYFPGCFRCHDGQHVSPEGQTIRNECEVCHTMLTQTEAGKQVATGQFQHPVDIGDLQGMACADCHTGGVGP